jgi:hypothetical protein
MKWVLPVLLIVPQLAAADEFLFFRSPTGNIHCGLFDGDYPGARCDLTALQPSFTDRPADCDLDWGQSFGIGPHDRKGQVLCVGDTVAAPEAFILGYGASVDLGGFRCSSERSGMTCTNPVGHGFSVSKAAQRLF